MKKIIIPTDFSGISRNSIIYGFELAKQLQLEVELIHVVELYKYTLGNSEAEILSTILPPENINEIELAANESFNKLINEIKAHIQTVYSCKVITGNLVNELVTLSSLSNSELIIMAVADKQDLITRFTHNTLSSIISDALCPVMVVPWGNNYSAINRIVYATDYNKFDITALKKLVNTLGSMLPEINIVHVLNKEPDFKAELKFAGFKHIVSENINYSNITYNLHTHKNVVKGIIDYAQKQNADLLVMIKQHEGFFSSLFETGKTEKVTHYLKLPMISYAEKE